MASSSKKGGASSVRELQPKTSSTESRGGGLGTGAKRERETALVKGGHTTADGEFEVLRVSVRIGQGWGGGDLHGRGEWGEERLRRKRGDGL